MCFLKSGELFKDFDAIFNPMFGESIGIKRRLLVELAKGPRSGGELAEILDIGRNGRLSRMLRELEEGGFISSDAGKNPETGDEARVGKYRLRDNYTRFFLKYIADGMSYTEIGKLFNISVSAVSQKAHRLGIPNVKPGHPCKFKGTRLSKK